MQIFNSIKDKSVWIRSGVASGLLVVLCGLLIVFGWHTKYAPLVEPFPSLPHVAYNTALFFVLTGVSIVARGIDRRVLSCILGLIICVFGALTLVQHLSKVNFGLDFLFAEPFLEEDLSQATVVAPNTGFCFFLIGLALALGWRGKYSNTSRFFAGVLASIVFAIGAGAILGYILGYSKAYGWAGFNVMALPTATLFVISGGGILLLEIGVIRETSKKGLPTWLPVLPALSLLIITMTIYQALSSEEDEEVRRLIKSAAESMVVEIEESIDMRENFLSYYGGRIASKDKFDSKSVQDDTELLTKYLSGLNALLYIDNSNHISKIMEADGVKIADNIVERILLKTNKISEFMAMRDSLVLVFDNVAPSQAYFCIVVPVYSGNVCQGGVIGIFDIQKVIQRILNNWSDKFHIEIREHNRLIFSNLKNNLARSEFEESAVLSGLGAICELRISPFANYLSKLHSNLPITILIFGLFLSATAALLIYMVQLLYAKTNALNEAKLKLEDDIIKRIETENKLRESEFGLNLAQSIGKMGSWEVDFINNRVNWSKEAYRIFGYKEGEVEPSEEAFLSRVHPDDREMVRQTIRAAKKDKSRIEIEFKILLPDGNIRTVSAIVEPYMNANGEVWKLSGIVRDITEWKKAEEERTKLIIELQKALAEVKTLRGIIPICASCKKIRDDKGYWQQLESYIEKHTEADISHGICPDCMKKLYPEYYEELKKKQQ